MQTDVIKLFLVAIIILFFGCNAPQISDDRTIEVDNKDIATWIRDFDGCLHLRNKSLAIKIIKENNLMNCTKDAFLKIFKSPNKTENVDDKEVLEYYFDSTCADGKIIMEGDKCYAKFYFNNNKLVETGFPCE